MVMDPAVQTISRRSSDKLAWKILGYLLDVLVVVMIGLTAWAGRQLMFVESRLSVIDTNIAVYARTTLEMQGAQKEIAVEVGKLKEWRAETAASRFTAADGREVWKEIAVIRENMAKMTLVEPPTWLLDRISRLEQRLSNLENKPTK